MICAQSCVLERVNLVSAHQCSELGSDPRIKIISRKRKDMSTWHCAMNLCCMLMDASVGFWHVVHSALALWIPCSACNMQLSCPFITVFITMNRPTQSIIYVPLQVIRFQKSNLLILPYKYLKSCSEDFMLKNLILRTKSCGTAFITQHSWLLYFRQAEICLVKMICATFVPARKEGPALKYFYMIHRGGRSQGLTKSWETPRGSL